MKPIFTRNVDIRKTAFVNWRISTNDDIANLHVLADGFLSAAIDLAKTAVNNNSDNKADKLIFPILMNANHGIELYLKAIGWTLNKLNEVDNRIEGKHNIDQIFRNVCGKVYKYGGLSDARHFATCMNDLKLYIKELISTIKATDKKDKMDFSRYPIDDKYENHFYVDELYNVEIDLVNFIQRFENIKENLEDRAWHYYYTLEENNTF
jgi:hypothetical protein